MEVLTELRTAQVPREYYEELTETVRVGLREQRAVNAPNVRKRRAKPVKTGIRSARRKERRPPRPKRNNSAVFRRKLSGEIWRKWRLRMGWIKYVLIPSCPSGFPAVDFAKFVVRDS